MTDSAKIINETKNYILEIFKNGLSKQKDVALNLKKGIDLLVGSECEDIDFLKKKIIKFCHEELIELYNNPSSNQVNLDRIALIEKNFKKFVIDLNIASMSNLHQLPFERRLTNEESEILKSKLKNDWDFDGWNKGNYYWEPLAKTNNRNSLIFFKYDLFDDDDVKRIINLIKKISHNKILFLTEDQLDYEIDVIEFNLDLLESSYTNWENTWLIYISHEDIITIGGEILTELMKLEFPLKIISKNDLW
ncbi:hypothetical protein [Halpernia frigidisoli]|uniref:SIR2-like domain-containing protein n=1 Tax=Halpernia frigidisoli TaxID=1125876 RepID=A0A1I3FV32_9FLAO|nr:hypothetical protein [Halpernia frigidisoli]SFI15017.1 hypothetical protein SAMN05443292_1645 [Halpernia frigidisoli]